MNWLVSVPKCDWADRAWVIHTYWADLDDLLEDANSPNPLFDAAAVRRLVLSMQDRP